MRQAHAPEGVLLWRAVETAQARLKRLDRKYALAEFALGPVLQPGEVDAALTILGSLSREGGEARHSLEGRAVVSGERLIDRLVVGVEAVSELGQAHHSCLFVTHGQGELGGPLQLLVELAAIGQLVVQVEAD